MAYPTISSPYGLRPVNLIGGLPFAGATRKRRIVAAYAPAIGYGEPLANDTDGTVIISAATSAGPATGFAGVFLGCEYIDPVTGQLRFSEYYPGAVTPPSGFITAYVCDDPNALFKAVIVSGTTTVTGVQYTAVGENAIIIKNTLSTVTGNSTLALNASTATTATYPIRIVDVVQESAYVSGGNTIYPEVIVKFNNFAIDGNGATSGGHAYNNPLGT